MKNQTIKTDWSTINQLNEESIRLGLNRTVDVDVLKQHDEPEFHSIMNHGSEHAGNLSVRVFFPNTGACLDINPESFATHFE